ncbi:hypothetical protein [Demequina sp.]|uniref:alpha/beta hydrolase family protein n=1 Tax=Demequina sp. TaxID=2050685 RepID=UPI0025DCEFB9|nr:hypothetical protein [Demequina sp.]
MSAARGVAIGGAVTLLVVTALLVRLTAAWVPLQPRESAAGGARAADVTVASGQPLGTMRVELAGLESTVWYPAADDASGARARYPLTLRMDPALPEVTLGTTRGAAVLDAPWAATATPAPLVLLSPGFALPPSAYSWLGEALAAGGRVVIAPDHGETLDPAGLAAATVARPRELTAVLDAVEALASPGGPWHGRVDSSAVDVMGHSYGGYAAQAMGGARLDTRELRERCAAGRTADHPGVFLCDALEPHLREIAADAGLAEVPADLWPSWRDERVVSVVSLAGDAAMFGDAGLAHLNVPVLAVGGDADRDSPVDWGVELTAAAAGAPATLHLLEGAGHMDLLDSVDVVRPLATLLPGGFVERSPAIRRAFHAEVLDAVAAHLRPSETPA